MDKQKLASEIHEQYLLAKRYLDPIHERMNKQEELFRSYINPQNYEHSARVFDPRVFRVIETITPRMVQNEPTGSFYPQEEGDMAVAHVLNSLTKYDWRRAEMFPKLVNFVKSMLIFGTAFGRCFWELREKDKTMMEPKKVNGRMVWTPKNSKTKKVTEFDGPNFEVLNIYDCFPDPNATNLDNMRWFIYRTFRTVEELENENETRGGSYYQNLDELKTKIEERKKGGGKPSDMQYREHRRVMLNTQELTGEDTSNPELVVLKRFTRDRWVDYVPDYDLVIRDIENPYFHGELPIVYGVDYPYPGELYGMGEIEPIDRIQRAINAVLNQRLDNVQLTLNTMWKVKKGAGVDMHTLVSKPGNIVTVGDMTALEAIQVPDVTGATFVDTMNYLTAAMQNGSGITDYTVGINSGANTVNDTATGTRLIQQEANMQFKLKIQLFSHMVVRKIVNQWKDLRIQYTTEEQSLRILGKEDIAYLKDNTNLSKTDMSGNPITPGDLQTTSKLDIKNDTFAFLHLLPEDIQPSIVGDYDFIDQVSSEQLTDPVVMQQNFFSALDRVTTPAWTQGMAQTGKKLNFEFLTEQVFDKLQLGMDAKSVIEDIPPPTVPPQPQMPGQEPSLLDGQMPPDVSQQINDLATMSPEEMNGQPVPGPNA